jgi:hypothetical protein
LWSSTFQMPWDWRESYDAKTLSTLRDEAVP